ncbi:MAG TPA: type 1 glutamine amidotransferase domain-containing protein [Stellaceae bacterium]|nr:type 1 glutamine amidotransferase domain-containing protein [Stellaceae bacterium]
MAQLSGKRIAILATDGFEQSELIQPRDALRGAGAQVEVVGPHSGHIQGMQHHDKGDRVAVDRTLDEARPDDYDALVQPGGVANPDALRLDRRAVAFFRAFVTADKPIAVICHGPWMLIEAEAAKGRTVTSWPSLKTDLKNAGADWVDREVVVDGKLVTSRNPDDLPAFCREAVALFAGGARDRRRAEE